MTMTDGKKAISIWMRMWTSDGYSEDMSHDFFEAGKLPLVWVDAIGNEVRQVKDIQYCIEQAEDWAAYRGDFYDPEAEKSETMQGLERVVDVEILCEA